MPHTFDCSCRLRVAVPDAEELQRLAATFTRLADDRAEVHRVLVALVGDEEHVDVQLTTDDVAAARRLARELVDEVARHLTARFGPDAVHAGELHIRSAAREATPPLAPDPPADGFGERLHAALSAAHAGLAVPLEDVDAAVRAAGTRGPGGHPSTRDVLAKLDEWHVFAHDLELVDVGPHHLVLRFPTMPEQLHRFAEDVLLFCPAVTDEVEALDELVDAPAAVVARVAVEGIAANLRASRLLRLWWD